MNWMKKQLLNILENVIAIVVVMVTLALFMLPGFVVGMWFGGHLEWFRVIVFATGFWVGLLWMRGFMRRKYRFLEERHKEQQKLLKEAMQVAEELSKEKLEGLMSVVSDFYEGSPITHHVLQLKLNSIPTLRIGDDNHMVEVDWEYASEEGFIAALERAKMEWQAKETHE